MTPEQLQLRHDDPDAFGLMFVEETLREDQQRKIEMARTEDKDLPNRVMYIPTDEDLILIVIPMAVSGKDLSPVEGIMASCAVCRQQAGSPFMIALCAEAYVKTADTKGDLPRQRGVLTEQFHHGDRSVTEALTVMAVHRRRNGRLRTLAVHLPFHDDDTEVIFGEPTWADSLNEDTASGGAIPEAIAAAFGSEQN